jgi:hypothetical protein
LGKDPYGVSGRELVVDAAIDRPRYSRYSRYNWGKLYDAHFTDTEFFLALSKELPARERKRERYPEHTSYARIRSVVMAPQGDGYYWVKIRTGSPQHHFWSCLSGPGTEDNV